MLLNVMINLYEFLSAIILLTYLAIIVKGEIITLKELVFIVEISMIGWCFVSYIIPDWNKQPLVKDYFCLLLIGEIGVDWYFKLKKK